ncbi:MAG: hypothetical protein ACREA2_15325 [Blastocatellia bacterium]
MKVLCPRCNEPINLGYLEKTGAQMACCPECGTVVSATYKKDDHRAHWKFEVEFPLPKEEFDDGGCGCGAAIVILIALLILIAIARCDRQAPDKLLIEAFEETLQN